MKKVMGLILASILLVTLVGCRNTVAGFGKDMQNTGEKIQHKVSS